MGSDISNMSILPSAQDSTNNNRLSNNPYTSPTKEPIMAVITQTFYDPFRRRFSGRVKPQVIQGNDSLIPLGLNGSFAPPQP